MYIIKKARGYNLLPTDVDQPASTVEVCDDSEDCIAAQVLAYMEGIDLRTWDAHSFA